jgi:hypothetical protein
MSNLNWARLSQQKKELEVEFIKLETEFKNCKMELQDERCRLEEYGNC